MHTVNLVQQRQEEFGSGDRELFVCLEEGDHFGILGPLEMLGKSGHGLGIVNELFRLWHCRQQRLHQLQHLRKRSEMNQGRCAHHWPHVAGADVVATW